MDGDQSNQVLGSSGGAGGGMTGNGQGNGKVSHQHHSHSHSQSNSLSDNKNNHSQAQSHQPQMNSPSSGYKRSFAMVIDDTIGNGNGDGENENGMMRSGGYGEEGQNSSTGIGGNAGAGAESAYGYGQQQQQQQYGGGGGGGSHSRQTTGGSSSSTSGSTSLDSSGQYIYNNNNNTYNHPSAQSSTSSNSFSQSYSTGQGQGPGSMQQSKSNNRPLPPITNPNPNPNTVPRLQPSYPNPNPNPNPNNNVTTSSSSSATTFRSPRLLNTPDNGGGSGPTFQSPYNASGSSASGSGSGSGIAGPSSASYGGGGGQQQSRYQSYTTPSSSSTTYDASSSHSHSQQLQYQPSNSTSTSTGPSNTHLPQQSISLSMSSSSAMNKSLSSNSDSSPEDTSGSGSGRGSSSRGRWKGNTGGGGGGAGGRNGNGNGNGHGKGKGDGGDAAGEGNIGAADQETFEFMKRKKWPQLLMQELVGAAVWCLIPYEHNNTYSNSNGSSQRRSGWKIAFATPATMELLGYEPEELEGRDWADVISAVDLPRILATISNTITPQEITRSPAHYQTSASRTSSYGAFEYPMSRQSNGSTAAGDPPVGQDASFGQFRGPAQSMSVFTRMVNKSGREVLFELRGHAYFGEEDGTEDAASPEGNGGFDGGGVMGVPSQFSTSFNHRRISHSRSLGGLPPVQNDERQCKAFWIMGRRWTGQGDGGGKMLDTFLELKMENERLKQELRDLQMNGNGKGKASGSSAPTVGLGLGVGTPSSGHARFPSQSGTLPTSRPAPPSSDEEEESESDDESYEEPSMPARQYSPPIAQQPSSYPMPNQNYNNVPPYGMMSAFPQAHEQRIEPLEKKQKVARDPLDKGKEKEKKPKKPKAKPEYVCQNCGRNDSPEWRKGPLGPKTLCNACGLRWAKKNGIIPSKRSKKERDQDDQEQIGGMGENDIMG